MSNQQWFVFKLGKQPDPNQPVVAQGPQAARPAPRRVLERRREDGLEFIEENPVPEADDQGHGFKINAEGRKDMTHCFTTEAAAERWAKEQAQLNPKQMFGIFACIKVFETTTPTVIEKEFNQAGELLVRSTS